MQKVQYNVIENLRVIKVEKVMRLWNDNKPSIRNQPRKLTTLDVGLLILTCNQDKSRRFYVGKSHFASKTKSCTHDADAGVVIVSAHLALYELSHLVV